MAYDEIEDLFFFREKRQYFSNATIGIFAYRKFFVDTIHAIANGYRINKTKSLQVIHDDCCCFVYHPVCDAHKPYK